MKKFLLFIAICTSVISVAQNLEDKIPGNVQAVVSVNGNRMLDLISISEFNKFNFTKELLKEASKNDRNKAVNGIEDFGFDLNSNAYYFYQQTDSINYHNMIIKLADKNKFENLLSSSEKENIELKDGVSMINESSNISIWNSNMLLLTFGDQSYNYFKDHEARFKKQRVNEDESYYQIKKRITNKWERNHALNIFNSNVNSSIKSNANYIASKDDKAVASAWIKNYGQLLGTAMSGIYGAASMSSIMGPNSSMYGGFKSVVANLYFDNNAVKMTTKMEVTPEWQDMLKKIYNSKMNKKFFNYFDENNMMAYMGMSMNMQAMFEEYPALVTSMYGGMLPDYKDEMKLGGELMSILLDEEAIGELITGDMLFILNDISEKDVEYTSYDYDEDYNKIETIKTKKELRPDFTIMIGSEKGNFLNRSAMLGVKKNLIEKKSGYYKVKVPKNEFPIDLFMAIKDDILFLTSSEKNISNIVRGNFSRNVGKHEKLIRNSISAFYMNGGQIFSKVPVSELSDDEESYLNFAQNNFKDAYFKSSKIKGNKVLSEMKINTNDRQGNSLKLLFNFIEVLAK